MVLITETSEISFMLKIRQINPKKSPRAATLGDSLVCPRGHHLIRDYFYYSHLRQNCQTENSCKIFFPMQILRACPNKNLRFLANCLCYNTDVACHRTLPYVVSFYERVDIVSTLFFASNWVINPCFLCGTQCHIAQ